MTTLTEFLTARLDEDEAAAAKAGGVEWIYNGHHPLIKDASGKAVVYEHAAPDWFQASHIVRHDPARVLREVAAKRRVMERHSPMKLFTTVYCDGCPMDDDGSHTTELKGCPELQDLAFIWNEHEDWDQDWCPHVEGRHEEDVMEVPPARGCYTNACNRCGTGDGWHYRNREERAA